MTSPLPSWAAGSSASVERMSSSRLSQSESCASMAFSGSQESMAQPSAIGLSWDSPLPSCISSRGCIFPVAALDMILSRSPRPAIWSRIPEQMSASERKASMQSYRAFSSSMSMDGIASQLRSILAPIGLWQRSITSTRELPSGPAVLANISRLRRVKRSIQTKSPFSMRERVHILSNPLCWVCSR